MPKWISQSLSIGTRAALAGALLLTVACALLRVFDSSRPGDYGEGTILAMVERMQEESISAAWLDGPVYTLSFYGPGYYRAVQAVTAVTPWRHTLIPGRLVSLLATLATAALITLIVWRGTGSCELGMAAALIFLVSPIVYAWGTPHRVDPLATLFAIGAYLAIGHRRHGVWGSAVCVAAGSLVKQTVALTALPIFLYLLLARRYKAGLWYAILVAVLGIVSWFVLDAISGGYFLATAIQGNLGTMWPTQGFWAGYAFLCTPLGLIASIVVVYRFVERPAAITESVYAIGFVMSTLLAALLSCKEGAAPSYFLEASALGTVVIGLYGLPILWSMHKVRASLVFLLLAMLLAAPGVRFLRERGLQFQQTPHGLSVVSQRLDLSGDTLVLADGQYLPAVLHAGGTPLLNDPFAFRVLVDKGSLKPTPVVEAMQRGEVKYLVLKRTVEGHREQIDQVSQKWPAEIVEAMQQYYVLDTAGDELFIYRYRPAAPEPALH